MDPTGNQAEEYGPGGTIELKFGDNGEVLSYTYTLGDYSEETEYDYDHENGIVNVSRRRSNHNLTETWTEGLIPPIIPVTDGFQQDNPKWKQDPLSGFWTFDKGIPNTIGAFGCTFTSYVNAGNAIRKAMGLEIIDLAAMNKPENFVYLPKGGLFTTSCDVLLTSEKKEKIIKDMTGINVSIKTINGDKAAIKAIKAAQVGDGKVVIVAKMPSQVTRDGKHYVNVNGIDKNGNLQYFETYSGNKYRYRSEQILSVDIIKIY